MAVMYYTVVIIIALIKSTHGAPYIERYVSPFLDMSYNLNSLGSEQRVDTEDDCVLHCVVTAHCVAVNMGPVDADGSRTCQLKHHLVTLQKWLTDRPGYAYFHVVPPSYTRTGCYRFSTRSNFDYIDNIYRQKHNDWQEDSFGQMVPGCAALAWRRGYDVFGLEFAGVCWATHKTVDYRSGGTKIDDDWAGCKYNVGTGDSAISMFEFDLE